MIVMTNHEFCDDVEKVLWNAHEDKREIVFSAIHEGSMIISKVDVIALAKEFNLMVCEKDVFL